MSTRARDIFIVANNIEELGGLQRWAHQMAGLFAASGHAVHLIGVTHGPTRHDYGQDAPYARSVLHEQHPASPWEPHYPWQWLDVRAWQRERRRRQEATAAAGELSRLFASAAPGGIVIVPQVWAMRWVSLADLHGMPVIGMSHESWSASAATWRRRGVRELFPGVARLLLLTQEDADAWARDGLSNVGVMPNPLPLVPSAPSPLQDEVVLSLGRFSYEKGYDLLLEAWAVVAQAFPTWRLRLVGSGPLLPDLVDQARLLGVSESVDFPGPTSDVEQAYMGASAFALTSRAEGFPMTLLEAAACGLPSVSFDCAPGVREIVEDGETGILVRPGNTERFAAELSALLLDPGLRRKLGERARERSARFAPESVLEQWQQVFRLVYR